MFYTLYNGIILFVILQYYTDDNDELNCSILKYQLSNERTFIQFKKEWIIMSSDKLICEYKKK